MGMLSILNQSENAIIFIVFMSTKTIVYVKYRLNKIEREWLSSEKSSRMFNKLQTSTENEKNNTM